MVKKLFKALVLFFNKMSPKIKMSSKVRNFLEGLQPIVNQAIAFDAVKLYAEKRLASYPWVPDSLMFTPKKNKANAFFVYERQFDWRDNVILGDTSDSGKLSSTFAARPALLGIEKRVDPVYERIPANKPIPNHLSRTWPKTDARESEILSEIEILGLKPHSFIIIPVRDSFKPGRSSYFNGKLQMLYEPPKLEYHFKIIRL